MIKLIASDLDGTIIDGNGQCDPSVIETIDAFRALGIKFAICSGRPADSVTPLLKGWNLEGRVDFLIGTGGGEVLDMSTGKRTNVYPLQPDLLLEIMDLYEPLGLVPTVQDGMNLYVQRIDEHVEKLGQRIGINIVETDVRKMVVKPEGKEMMIVDPALMPQVEEFAKEHQDPRYVAFKTAHDLFEMNDPRLAKDVGIQIVASIMNITPNEIMAFGDTTNDIQMLSYVRYGIAMENGTDDAKSVAFAIAPSIHEQGFAKFISAHLVNAQYKA